VLAFSTLGLSITGESVSRLAEAFRLRAGPAASGCPWGRARVPRQRLRKKSDLAV